MKYYYSTDCGLIPHSLRTDLPIIIYIDDFIYSKSPYLKLIETNETINNFIIKNKSIKCIYGLKGRETKTGNYKLKRESGEYLFKKEEFKDFFKTHEIKFKVNEIKKTHEIKGGVLIDNLKILNEYIFKEDLLIIDLKGFLRPLKVIKFNKKTLNFEYTEVSEYLRHLYKNREINYFMQIIEITINEFEKFFKQKLYFH